MSAQSFGIVWHWRLAYLNSPVAGGGEPIGLIRVSNDRIDSSVNEAHSENAAASAALREISGRVEDRLLELFSSIRTATGVWYHGIRYFPEHSQWLW
jgi:hypothetical protein